MKMSKILGVAGSSAIISAATVLYFTAPIAKPANAGISPEIVYVDRVVEKIVEIPVKVVVKETKTTWLDKTSEEDLNCLAQNVYFESRGESHIGQSAVAWVTLNRVVDKQFPDSICEVVWQTDQFSWTNDGKSDKPKDAEAWDTATKIAEEVLSEYGYSTDPTEGSTYFHASYSKPGWRHEFERIVLIDQHVFYVGTHPKT